MLVDSNKIGDPQGSYSWMWDFKPSYILFPMPRKMYHFIHLQEENVFEKHRIPNNRICHAINDRKENFRWLFPKFLLSEA